MYCRSQTSGILNTSSQRVINTFRMAMSDTIVIRKKQ